MLYSAKNLLSAFVLLCCYGLRSQVAPAFTITSLSPSYSITCATLSVNLATTVAPPGSYTYSWVSGAATLTGANVFITNPGIYTVTVYASPTLATTQTVAIGINTVAPPSSVLSPTFQNITCILSSITTVTATNPSSFIHLWLTPQGGTVSSVLTPTSVFTPGGTGTFTHVTVNPLNGCTGSKTFSVSSSSNLPIFDLTSTNYPPYTITCAGLLTVNIANAQSTIPPGGGPVSYTLLPPLSSTVLPGGPLGVINSFTLNTPGTWTAVVRDNVNGCETRSAFSVLQSTQAPVVSASANTPTSCSGSSVVITATGAHTYTFTGGITSGVAFVPPASGIFSYSVVGKDTISNCISPVPVIVTITVSPKPTVGISSSSSSVCAGNTVTLSGTGGADVYSWSGGVTNGQSFIPALTATYTVTGTYSLTGCSNTATSTIVVFPLPVVTSSASSLSVCSGNTVVLSGSGGLNNSWSSGVSNNLAFSPSVTSTYTFTGTDANGCSNSTFVTITVNPSPTVSVTASAPVFCYGMSSTLTALGAVTYTWDGGSTNSNIVVNPQNTTVYTVTGTGANGCTQSSTYTLIVNTSSNFNYTVSALTVTLEPGPGCTSLVWDLGNGTTTTTSINPVVTYSLAGTYSVCLKCSGLPDACMRCFNIQVPSNSSGGVGITELKNNKAAILIYPNPNNGGFMLITPPGYENKKLAIFNYLGQLIYQTELDADKTKIQLDVPTGLYYYRIVNAERTRSGQFIIE